MLPAHVAQNVKDQIRFYLESTFDFRDPEVERALDTFIHDPEQGMFKGPWVQLKRPFRPANTQSQTPFDIQPSFHPFMHQYKSWLRLSSKGESPQSTIVTTGTGSGKTECFLYPILDHCTRALKDGQRGIKAIVLYPMNALAADQEKRFAHIIWNDPQLKQAGIRVGNYTGRYDPADPGASATSGTSAMGAWHGISNHEAQQENPPDILLTNYKMLDFLLLRPQDQRLWRFNEPNVLQYLVLDELHTYDGAQGADVGCLIRRLKERLAIPKGELCVVGTSATLDDRERDSDRSSKTSEVDAQQTSSDRLRYFAETLFEESISIDAIIQEDRLNVEEIVHHQLEDIPFPEAKECEPLEGETALHYALRQSIHWDCKGVHLDPKHPPPDDSEDWESWAEALGEWLKGIELFKTLLEAFEKADHEEEPLSWEDLIETLAQQDFGIQKFKPEERSILIASFFALVAHAKERRSQRLFPLVPTQVQLWIRELGRVGLTVTPEPEFSWLDEPHTQHSVLPAFHCSVCGESGWIGLHKTTNDSKIAAKGVEGLSLGGSPEEIYASWFAKRRSEHIVLVSKRLPTDAASGIMPNQDWHICEESLVLRRGRGECPLSNSLKCFEVKINNDKYRDTKTGMMVGKQACPHCDDRDGIRFLGSRSASLSSVAIDEMFGSTINSDPKLLAFTDSVQDASHRAGFFTARTYNFTLRTALQHLIDEWGSEGIPMDSIGKNLIYWCSEDLPGRPGTIGNALSSLMPPDLQEYSGYLEYRQKSPTEDPPPKFFNEIATRLGWQVTREFGIGQIHGRTLELNACSCLGWDEEIIDSTIDNLYERLPGIDPFIQKIKKEKFKLWLYGFLHRYRLRGALEHHFLEEFARSGSWGKSYFGKSQFNRETFPPWDRYAVPKLISLEPSKKHEHVLATTKSGSASSPWNIIWARRILKEDMDEATIIDLLRILLKSGDEEGLFKRYVVSASKEYYTISRSVAKLYPQGVQLECSDSHKLLFRPESEAKLWEQAPSLEYYAPYGIYEPVEFKGKQKYYQNRYRKGALRRVVSKEHTGLLATEDREDIERSFAKSQRSDDPNVLTCTSTLEMGIDIGDLSSTMLCSIPPSTANFLQRIGRAGRSTGTALIISFVNLRPHDLFFFARPKEMLRGKVDPPGCWLDASAVLTRQFLAYCFDCATKEGVLPSLPKTGKQLVDDLDDPKGLIQEMMAWVTLNEGTLRTHFLNRFELNIKSDTIERFTNETQIDLLYHRIQAMAKEYDQQRREIENSRKRLNTLLNSLDQEEVDTQAEVQRELRILKGRASNLGRISALELFTDHGLLPNYAFPERGVKFYGAVYNPRDHRENDHKSIEVVRSAGTALKELAPGNHFYTHSRKFDIQQISLGNRQNPIIETLAICGACGHLRNVEELKQPEASLACPQCGHESDNKSQRDRGQQRSFIEFSKSQALSYMEQYKSLSGDSLDDRQSESFILIPSFDLTQDSPNGAVVEENLPFGIEYRSTAVLKEVNAGFFGQDQTVPFGPAGSAPDEGFKICRHCGVYCHPKEKDKPEHHRKSCSARKKYEKSKQAGKIKPKFEWESIYLYRKLQSEAIRLLLPPVTEAEIETLTACISLGFRRRFEGNPAHLIVNKQIMPLGSTGQEVSYLMLLDAVPGGTGYLKTLFQEKNEDGIEAEGILEVLRLALDTLETCPCRRMSDRDDTDGCYRCLRAYNNQYNAKKISRESGIRLLTDLIKAGNNRVSTEKLEQIHPQTLFESRLEERFTKKLEAFVEEQNGTWESTIIKGATGYRFTLNDNRYWELELQPKLGQAQAVMIQSQPDFLIHCDDDDVKPIAVFTDGFKFHCHPENRLKDDIRKRRAILESERYHVWSITWQDLTDEELKPDELLFNKKVQHFINNLASKKQTTELPYPNTELALGSGMGQLKAFLKSPMETAWADFSKFLLFCSLRLTGNKTSLKSFQKNFKSWVQGNEWQDPQNITASEVEYCEIEKLPGNSLIKFNIEDEIYQDQDHISLSIRLKDSNEDVSQKGYEETWRRYLSLINLFQFHKNFQFWVTSDSEEIEFSLHEPEIKPIPKIWKDILEDIVPSAEPIIQNLISLDDFEKTEDPQFEFYPPDLSDGIFGELAWERPSDPVVFLAGAQVNYQAEWEKLGWIVVTKKESESHRECAERLLNILLG